MSQDWTPQRSVDVSWLIPDHGARQRDRLHHATLPAELAECDDLVEGLVDRQAVTTTCGRVMTNLTVPGIFTRQLARRCAACCRALGYPKGIGSPKNDDACRALLGLAS